MNQNAINWALQYLLASNQATSISYQKVADTSYSVVYQIRTANDVFYLKQIPEALLLEPVVLDFLQQKGSSNTPVVIAKNNLLSCFLMRACGDISLRHLFQGTLDLVKLKQGIASYTKIQRLVELDVAQLLTLGIPDWCLSNFASLFWQLIQQTELLHTDGLTTTEIDRLHELYPICRTLCDELAKYKILETIGHCDLHENNMLLDHKTGAINIIDWSETVVTHPFFSLQGCLWQITHIYGVKKTDRLTSSDFQVRWY